MSRPNRSQTLVRDPNHASVHIVTGAELTAQAMSAPDKSGLHFLAGINHFEPWFKARQGSIMALLTEIMAQRWTSQDLQRGDLIQLTTPALAELNTGSNPTAGLYVYDGRAVVALERDSIDSDLCWLPTEFKFPEFPPDYWHGPNGMNPDFNICRVDLSLFQDSIKKYVSDVLLTNDHRALIMMTSFQVVSFDDSGAKKTELYSILDDQIHYLDHKTVSTDLIKRNKCFITSLLGKVRKEPNQSIKAAELFSYCPGLPADSVRAGIYQALPEYVKHSNRKFFWSEADMV